MTCLGDTALGDIEGLAMGRRAGLAVHDADVLVFLGKGYDVC